MKKIDQSIWDRAAILNVIKTTFARFGADQGMRVAASLSYTSLLALVPLMSICFAIFAAFPVFESVQHELLGFVFNNFMPAAGEQVQEYLQSFTQNTGRMTTVGIIGLALTALMLLSTIENALNKIFKVREPRPLVPRFMMFWALLTLGPLLMGASLSLSTYFFTLTKLVGVDRISGFSTFAGVLLPNILMIAALTLFYVIVPNRRIVWSHGIVGAATAGTLFALLKKAFGFYVATFPSYQNLYGALATIPIFLVWMYLAWSVVLLGAMLTSTLTDWQKTDKDVSEDLSPGQKLGEAMEVVRLLVARQVVGGALPGAEIESVIGRGLAGDPVVSALLKACIMVETADEAFVLARDASTTSLDELYRALGLAAEAQVVGNNGPIAEIVEKADLLRAEAMKVSLRELIVKA